MLKKTALMIALGIVVLMVLWLPHSNLHACTNYLITKGASADGSTMITYAADAHVLYGELYYWPAQDHMPGSMLDIYEWDTGKYLGKIKQVPHTYNVVGLMNEHQVSVGETTWGGRSELRDPKAIMDYGSLMFIALQRAKTAREAITVMTDLVAEYGYASVGESFSISGPNEVWFMDLISKGPDNKGAVWVARRIPDGYISAHANQARIRQFPLNDPKNCLYAKDVISFAREKKYFEGKDEDFSFVDAYAPPDFGALRFCEARVWSMFRRTVSDPKTMDKYLDYVKGDTKAEPVPFWIKPDKKISVRDVMELMRDHFEGTPLDMTKDLGAGPFRLPYRWRPLNVPYPHSKPGFLLWLKPAPGCPVRLAVFFGLVSMIPIVLSMSPCTAASARSPKVMPSVPGLLPNSPGNQPGGCLISWPISLTPATVI